MISVRPDPAHPRGGYAELLLPEGDLAGDSTQVSVFDNYSERYLGEAGWQATQVMFGPYAVTRAGGQARLIIGPEIVNQIEEYANVRMTVGDASHDISWPDEVVPATGAAKIGGIMGATQTSAAPKSALTAKMPDPEPAPEAPNVVAEPVPEPIADPVPSAPPEKSGKGALIGGILLLVLLAAGALFWFMRPAEEPPEPVAEQTAPLSTDPCAIAQLSALQGFAAQATALRGCGAKASADAALGLVERAAAGEDADALVLFGTVYDGQDTDSVIEDTIGLTFGDVPATAAEYYARAVAAGSTEAAAKLEALCTRMEGMTDTLIRGAVTDYCGN